MKSARDRSPEDPWHQLRNHTLLAPATWHQVHRFRDLTVDESGHDELIGAIQRFRGKAYMEDGALSAGALTADGRHCQAVDAASWHLVVRNDNGDILSCARYFPLTTPRFESTIMSKSALANSAEWREKVKQAVEASIKRANARGAVFAELGGWCVAKESRNSTQALRTVLLMYALGEVLGGTVGLSTATKRHSSSSILQRLGAKRADVNGEVLPAYFEPMFDCEMELLQFDSLHPAERYAPQVAEYSAIMKRGIRVVCAQPAPPTCIASLTGLFRALSPATQLDALTIPQEI